MRRLVHAPGWSHSRRQCVDAARAAPRLGAEALDRIAAWYREEAPIRTHGLAAEAKLAQRGEYTKALVAAFFSWLKQPVSTELLLPATPFAQAARSALEREAALKVFLADPEVPIDPKPREREMRALALGRRNWLFCGTEVGARPVGLRPSLLASCRWQGLDPSVDRVDVRHRVATPPAFDVHLLTPRWWKQHFAEHPWRADLDRLRQ